MENVSDICDCEDFKIGMEQIVMAVTYKLGAMYTGKAFKFCPWCGKELKLEDMDGATEIP